MNQHVVALLSQQGTACLETALYGEDDTPANRLRIEADICPRDPDPPVPGTWTDVSDNDAFWPPIDLEE
jgi:hypothetical protein